MSCANKRIDRKADAQKTSDGKPLGWKRRELQEGKRGDYFAFVNGELLPHLRELRDQPGANAKQKVISEIISPIERVRIDTESNFADVLDRVHALRLAGTDTQHQFMLSQVSYKTSGWQAEFKSGLNRQVPKNHLGRDSESDEE